MSAPAHPSSVANVTAPIATAETHPAPRSQPGRASDPITSRRPASQVITPILGPTTAPLITALQYSASIGVSGENTVPVPSTVAPAIAP